MTLAAFSPFIPLNPDDSSLPATVMQFTLKNDSTETLCGTLAGWLQNSVCRESGGAHAGDLVNQLDPDSGSHHIAQLSAARSAASRPA